MPLTSVREHVVDIAPHLAALERQVQEAHAVLIDPECRRRYDLETFGWSSHRSDSATLAVVAEDGDEPETLAPRS